MSGGQLKISFELSNFQNPALAVELPAVEVNETSATLNLYYKTYHDARTIQFSTRGLYIVPIKCSFQLLILQLELYGITNLWNIVNNRKIFKHSNVAFCSGSFQWLLSMQRAGNRATEPIQYDHPRGSGFRNSYSDPCNGLNCLQKQLRPLQ